jgi:glycosyltransferase involved in cell wall biosynthesis
MMLALRQYDALVAGRPIALVHSNTLAVLVGAVWAWRRRVKHLWHVHEIILSPKIVSRAFPFLVRLGADRVMSNSTLTERWLLDHQPALKSRSIVVFNGLPEQALADATAVTEFRSGTRALPDDVLIVLAGRLSHLKGQALLIDAVALLRRDGRLGGAHFAIVGDTAPGHEEIRVSLLRQVDAAGLEAMFTFVPFVKDIRPVWQAADIAVVPSTDPESFGMVAIEAMAAAVPVLAARHGGLLDIVEDEHTGLFFEPRSVAALADALHRLMSDAALRRRLGAAGQLRQKQRFSAESQVSNTEQVYLAMQRAAIDES